MAAFITVSDAAGRVLFRRAATDEEVTAALRTAEIAERESRSRLTQMARARAQSERARPEPERARADDLSIGDGR